MVRRFRTGIAIGALIALALPAWGNAAHADAVTDAKRRLDQINAEIDRLEEVSAIAAEDYDEALHDAEELAISIKQTEVRIAEKEKSLSGIESAVREAALRQIVGGGASGLEALLGSDKLSEQVQRNAYTELAVSAGGDAADQLDAALTDLAKERRLLERQKADALRLSKEVARRKASADGQLKKLNQLLAKAKAEYGEAKLEKARQDYIAAQEAKAAAEEERRRREEASRPKPKPRPRPQPRPQPAPIEDGGDEGEEEGGQTPPPPPPDEEEEDDGGHVPPPPSPGASGAVAAAMSQIGVPYRYAASKPGVAFDCSGLTSWAWGQAGVSLPRISRAQYAALPKVDRSDIQPGDLIFYYRPISHVALYIGGGQMVHAPNTGSHVKVAPVRWGKVTGIGRPG